MALPSKQDILDFIALRGARNKGDISRREIARAFDIRGDARADLRHLLKDMEQDGHLTLSGKKRMRLKGRLPPVTVMDVLDLDEDGDLICIPSNWREGSAPPPIILSHTRALKTIPPLGKGDRFLGKLCENKDGSYETIPIKPLGRKTASLLLGVFEQGKSGGLVRPINRKAKGPLVIEQSDCANAQKGDIVRVETIYSKNRTHTPPKGRIREVLGQKEDTSTYALISIAEHDIPHSFPQDVIDAVEKLSPIPPPCIAASQNHENWCEIPLITIDPVDARDHDDALFAEKCAEGWRVVVAIADVAWYVRPDNPLDREAQKRGNSTYLPDQVIPMLPERLSTDLCSLKAGKERPALAVEMIFTKNGTKISHRFKRIMMRSAAGLSYLEAQNAIDGRPSDQASPLMESVILPLWEAFRALSTAREARGPLALDLPERRIEFNEKGDVRTITRKTSLEAHRLVEEFMIQANICAAETLKAARIPLIYRIHDQPAPEKLDGVRSYLDSLGYSLAKGQVIKPSIFNQILHQAKRRDDTEMISQVLLRAQSRAVYDTDNLGHFGLSLRDYTHFTSPIRRYADLTIHRALIETGTLGDGGSTLSRESLQKTAEDITATERRSMQAERDCADRYLASFLEGQLGATFLARISGVTKYGLFITLDDTGADGFVPMKTLGNEYFIFEDGSHRLLGERSGKIYFLGQAVEVKLMEVTPLQGGLRFEMLTLPAPPQGPKSKSPPPTRAASRRASGRKKRKNGTNRNHNNNR